MEVIMESCKAVLITGCSSGIGKATALRLARSSKERAFTVWASARRKDSIADLEAAGCRTIALDVTDEPSMLRAVGAIEETHGAVSVLINNAGYAQGGAVEAVAMERVRRQFETNVFGLVRLTQLVLPRMRAQRSGRIVNLSSMGGKLVFPGAGFYHATKYAVEALSDALRFEVRGFGIQVIVIEPGLIKSGFGDAAAGEMTAGDNDTYGAFHEAVRKSTVDLYEKGALSRLAGVPDDVARTIERAITARHPRARYTVSGSAKLLLAQRAVLSDKLWDRFMRMSFPSPGDGDRAL
jgi:NAD(P)-dependent dehydrogenase (short-subunit alcohol dehydrogenase family)